MFITLKTQLLCTVYRLEASAGQIETDIAKAKQATELVISTMVSRERECVCVCVRAHGACLCMR